MGGLALALKKAGPGGGARNDQLQRLCFQRSLLFPRLWSAGDRAPGYNLSGNSPIAYSPSHPVRRDYPTGTTFYNGPPLGGSTTGPTNELDFTNGFLWTAQLWAAAGTDASESDLQPVYQYTTTLRTGPKRCLRWLHHPAMLHGLRSSIRAFWRGTGERRHLPASRLGIMEEEPSTIGTQPSIQECRWAARLCLLLLI